MTAMFNKGSKRNNGNKKCRLNYLPVISLNWHKLSPAHMKQERIKKTITPFIVISGYGIEDRLENERASKRLGKVG